MSVFPKAEINTDDAPDIVLAILAGESPTRCFNERNDPRCNHWARRPDDTRGGGAWYCQCCARNLGYKKNNPLDEVFMCDGTRI